VVPPTPTAEVGALRLGSAPTLLIRIGGRAGGMDLRTCPFCSNEFLPSRYHPGQTICSSIDCQRRRRTNYHRRKIAQDPVYKEQCRDSQRNWRERNQEYMSRHRAKLRSFHDADGDRSSFLKELAQVRELVKNNLAFDLKRCNAAVWLVSRSGRHVAKNIFASAEIIVVTAT
jgi:hypothetical protein